MTNYVHTSKNGTLARCNAKTPGSCPLGGRHYTTDEYAALVASEDPRALPVPALDADQDRTLTAENPKYAEAKSAWEQLNHLAGELEEADREASTRLAAWMIEQEIPKVCPSEEVARLNDEVSERVQAIGSQFSLSEKATRSLRTFNFVEQHQKGAQFAPISREAETDAWAAGLGSRDKSVQAELAPVIAALKTDPAMVRAREFVKGQDLAKAAIRTTSKKLVELKAEERRKRKLAANAVSGDEIRNASTVVWKEAHKWGKWNAAGVPSDARRLAHLTQLSPADVDASGPGGTFTNVWYAKGEDVSRVVSYTKPSLPGAAGFFTTESGERLQGETRHANYRKTDLGTKFGDADGLFVKPVESPKAPAVDQFNAWVVRDSSG